MILNKGWFTNASSRAMMVHSRLFDLFPAEGEDVIGKEGAAVMLNQTTRYARVKTVSVKVTDKEGAAVKGAQVQFLVLNMGEYFPIAKAETDEKGTVSLVTGLGSVRVLAFLPGMEGFAQADLDLSLIHIFNVMFTIPSAIFTEAFLSFIGIGRAEPQASLGVLINGGYQVLRMYPHVLIFPAIVIVLIMVCFSILGDGLRDALDPQMRK